MSGLLTASRLKTARACQRLHFIEYKLLWRVAEVFAALRFGTLLHKGLEAWWRAPKGSRLQAAFEAMAGEADPFDRVRAEELMRGYDARWGEEPYEVISVEIRFETKLINPATGAPSRTWRLGGKLDVLVRDLRDGRVLLIEHKTSSEDITPGSEYWRRLRMDGQVSIYYDGGASLGHNIEGCLYDVIKKPGIKPLKATPEADRKYTKPTKASPESRLYAGQRLEDETPEEFRIRLVETIAENPAGFYQRCEVARLESEMEEARFDTWQLGKQIHESDLAGRYPRNPDACVRFGKTCPYFGYCTGEETLENNPKFKKSPPHPELTEDHDAAQG